MTKEVATKEKEKGKGKAKNDSNQKVVQQRTAPQGNSKKEEIASIE